MELTTIEQIAIRQIIARQQEIQAEAAARLKPLHEELRLAGEEICRRMGLPVNALRTTHSIDLERMTVQEAPVALRPGEVGITPVSDSGD